MKPGPLSVSRFSALLAFVVLCISATVLWFFLYRVSGQRLTLTQVAFDALPGWNGSDDRAALAAFRRSCSVLRSWQPARSMGGAGYAGSARDWFDVCRSADRVGDSKNARIWFEIWFVPFVVGGPSEHSALLTGYYEPEIRASRSLHGRFATPLFGEPRDLVVADLGRFRSDLSGLKLTGRVEDHRLVPFPTRATIDADGLGDAPILMYADDPISVFFLQIQGSGRVRLDDGTMLRVAYAGQNGHAYTSIGRTLVERRQIERPSLSMQAIRDWLETHRGAARAIMETDESYVFFRELPLGDSGLGSPGTEGVPLTPETSVAVDPEFHALGVPMFVSAKQLSANPAGPAERFARLCVAQDTGGAVKGGLRADIFWGFSKRAEEIAGHMNANGELYVLLPKSLARHLATRFRESSW